METPTRPSPDPELNRLLQSWKVDPAEDPTLVARVWRRIEAIEQPIRNRARWIDDLVAIFARPLVAVSTVALFAAGGAALALMQNGRASEARFDRLMREYVASIDPVRMVASAPPGEASAVGPDHGQPSRLR